MKTATEKQLLKPVKISKKTTKAELRRTLARAIPALMMQEKIIKHTELDLQYERDQKEKAQDDFERQRIGYLDKTERLDEACGAITMIIAELHNSAILRTTVFENQYNTCGAEGIAAEIISRVNQIAADFSKARDEQVAQLNADHLAEVLEIEKKLDAAYDDASGANACAIEFREQRDYSERALTDITAKYEAEVELNKMAERQLRHAESSARNAWRSAELAKRPWWRKALDWARGTGPTFEFQRADRVPLGVDPQTGAIIYTTKGKSHEY